MDTGNKKIRNSWNIKEIIIKHWYFVMLQRLLYSQQNYYTVGYAIWFAFPRISTALQQKRLQLLAIRLILHSQRITWFIKQSSARKFTHVLINHTTVKVQMRQNFPNYQKQVIEFKVFSSTDLSKFTQISLRSYHLSLKIRPNSIYNSFILRTPFIPRRDLRRFL